MEQCGVTEADMKARHANLEAARPAPCTAPNGAGHIKAAVKRLPHSG